MARLQQSLRWAPEIAPYDWILIDSPPSFGPLTLNVLRAVEEIVIPVPLTYLGVNGCAQLTRTIEMVRKRYQRSTLRISMVIPTFYRRTNLAHELLEGHGTLVGCGFGARPAHEIPIDSSVVPRPGLLPIADGQDVVEVLLVDRVAGDDVGPRHSGEII